MFKLNAKSDTDSLLSLLSHFECDDHTVQMLTQQGLLPPWTSKVKLSLFTHRIPVHSSWLSSYMDVTQTILIILTIAGLFLDRPRIDIHIYTHIQYIYMHTRIMSFTPHKNPINISIFTGKKYRLRV